MDNSSVRRVRMVNNRPSLLLDGEDTLPLICALSVSRARTAAPFLCAERKS